MGKDLGKNVCHAIADTPLIGTFFPDEKYLPRVYGPLHFLKTEGEV